MTIRNTWYVPLCALVASLLFACQPEEKTPAPPPNILFIAVDDLRPELNCFGKSHIHSPNIDRLAASGMMFQRTYCQVPVCGASRASLLSGIRPTADRFVNYLTRLDQDYPGIPSLPRHFLDHGYTTLSRGKIFHHSDDQMDAWSEAPWSPQNHHADYGWFDYVDPRSIEVIRTHPDFGREGSRVRGPAFESPDVADTAYKDGKLARQAVEDLQRLSQAGKPFFLAVGFWKPHLPFNAPKKYWDLYDPDSIPLSLNAFVPENAPDAAIHNSGELRNYALIPAQGPVSRDTARMLTHGYYASISYTDAQIGKLLDALDELGLRENTIVVLWGDHGWNLEDHTLWCKHANFESAMRAPLIISAPGYAGKRSTPSLTEFVDLYPTLCDLTGVPQPGHLQGKSLVPLLENPEQPFKEAIYSRFHQGESVKTDRFVYTEWVNPGEGAVYARMLYDHDSDPLENINVAERPEYESTVSELSQKLATMRDPDAQHPRHLESSLEVISIDSGARREVYRANAHFEAPNWSRDGHHLIFNQEGRLYKIPLEGGTPAEIPTGFAVRCNNDHGISPDGSQLVISDQSRIYTLPMEGGTPTQVTDKAPSYWHGWSPDGQTLAYCAEREGNYDIYTLPVGGGTETRLTRAEGLDDGPDYSPDGQYIYFNSVRTGTMQIWRMKTDGSEQTQLTTDRYNDWFPHPSPDGQWIVFLSYGPEVEGHPANKNVRLRLMHLESGEIRVLAHLFGGQGTINVPSWAPDSKELAFVSYRWVFD